jgi:hypothetical protein
LGLSEIVALAAGLLIGGAVGAVLVLMLRVRPRPPREIRVTITPNDLPQRRASTLALDHTRSAAQPAGRGGPADPITLGTTSPARARAAGLRTDVLPRATGRGLVAFLITRPTGLDRAATWERVEATIPMILPGGPVAGRGTPVATLGPPIGGAAAVAVAVAVGQPAAVGAAPAERPLAEAGFSGQPGPTPETSPVRASDPGPTTGSGPSSGRAAAAPLAGPCSDERRVAAERCDLAERLGEQAATANQHLRQQQRAYDDLVARAAKAALVADPREIRSAKEAARLTFRRAHAAAHSREAVEAAAADWLTEINRINQAARDATVEGSRTRDASAQLALTVERLGLEADVARINAESAAEACLLAREALAACEEAQVDRRAGRIPVDPASAPVETARPKLLGGPEFEPGEVDEITPPSERAFAGAQPRILRMLRGEGDAVRTVVRELAGDDLDEQRRWQLLLSQLVDACVARAIEASSLEFPTDHGFWSPFSQAQSRDIATALASLGYRFDGLGGFSDGRIPSQRDLSLALGYAGLDPMRLRTWPTEASMPHLFDDVRVAADEYVASAAGELTLGEMVALLRGRAEPLAELWNNWGLIRPLLLEA